MSIDSNDSFVAAMNPLIEFLATLDLNDPESAMAQLNGRFPLAHELVQRLQAAFAEGVTAGWLCNREGGGARFSRVAKAGPASGGFSIDAVQLSGPGVWHRHTKGEIDLCFAAGGDAPTFENFPAGWVVFAPGSDHVPTVRDGTMNILYFLPDGAVEWQK